MKFQYFLRGLGCGILLASCVFYFTGGREVPAQMSEEEIVRRARELGMVEKQDPVRELLAARGEEDAEENPVSAQDMLEERQKKEAQQEKVALGKPDGQADTEAEKPGGQADTEVEKPGGQAGTEEKQPGDTGTEEVGNSGSQSVTGEKEKGSGQEKTTKKKKNRSSESSGQAAVTEIPKQTVAKAASGSDTRSGQEPGLTEETKTADPEVISIKIKGGTSSMIICQKLQKAGIIDNAADFDDYLIKNGYSKKLRSGTYELKKGMDFQEIANAISR